MSCATMLHAPPPNHAHAAAIRFAMAIVVTIGLMLVAAHLQGCSCALPPPEGSQETDGGSL
jgi:hypothetical protein